MVRRRTRKCPAAINFYGVKNAAWLTATTLPATETRITQAYFIRERIERELAQVIRRQKTGPIADFLASVRNATEEGIPHGLTPLLQTMLAAANSRDVVARIGWMNRHGVPAPIALSVQGDPRDHRHCRIFIEEGEPRIGIPEYWLWPEYAKHRAAYASYVRRLATLLRLPQLLKGYAAEREFASVFPVALERRQRIDTLTYDELRREYSHVDWPAMLTSWGLSVEILPTLRFNVTCRAFLHHMQHRLTSWPIERWQGWLALILTQWIAGILPGGPLRSVWFSYSRKYLQGMTADEDVGAITNAIVYTMMPNLIGKVWVQEHCEPSLKRHVTAMVRNIQAAAADALMKTEWMAPSTRRAAVKKLKAMDVQVCYPDLADWPIRTVVGGLSPTNYVENLLALHALGTDAAQEQIAKADCRHPLGNGWGRPVFEVNAFYYPDENRFLLPAAILRPPFYDSTKSIPWNYGAIGATIGHEFCHAFDAEGRAYDENGNKKDWWSERDDKEYRKRASRVVSLYESVPYRGMEVDGRLTLVENIADLGGLEFALVGAKKAMGRPLTKSELQEFFTSYAVSWRSKDRMRRASELLATDFHAPPMLRVNHVVRQMDAWYKAFDVGPECEGYITPAQRIHFFS